MRFREANVQPLGVNPAGVASHAAYEAKMHFGFPLLSDPDRTITAAYRALKEDGRGVQRTVYAIRRDGSIAFAARGAPPPVEVLA
ncbi:MAG: redoxin domain-containing protein, partial [Gemmatimonadaceae bacterium]